jgi:hypothetical protein
MRDLARLRALLRPRPRPRLAHPPDYAIDFAHTLEDMRAHVARGAPEPAAFSCAVALVSPSPPPSWRWPRRTDPPICSILGVWVRPCAMRRGILPRILETLAAALLERNAAAAAASPAGSAGDAAPAGPAIRACGGNCRRAVEGLNRRSAARGGAGFAARAAPAALDSGAARAREDSDWARPPAALPRLRLAPHRPLPPPAAALDPAPWSAEDRAERPALRLARRLGAGRADCDTAGSGPPPAAAAAQAGRMRRRGGGWRATPGGGGARTCRPACARPARRRPGRAAGGRPGGGRRRGRGAARDAAGRLGRGGAVLTAAAAASAGLRPSGPSRRLAPLDRARATLNVPGQWRATGGPGAQATVCPAAG